MSEKFLGEIDWVARDIAIRQGLRDGFEKRDSRVSAPLNNLLAYSEAYNAGWKERDFMERLPVDLGGYRVVPPVARPLLPHVGDPALRKFRS